MRRLLIALAAAALITGLGIPVALPAAASPYPTWCGSWDPNPAGNIHVTVDGSGAGPDGSKWQILIGQRPSTGVYYYWATLSHAKPGDQIALIWQYNNNGEQYQCGNAQGDRTATVYSGTTGTYTSGVPASSVTSYDCELWAVNNSSSYCY